MQKIIRIFSIISSSPNVVKVTIKVSLKDTEEYKIRLGTKINIKVNLLPIRLNKKQAKIKIRIICKSYCIDPRNDGNGIRLHIIAAA